MIAFKDFVPQRLRKQGFIKPPQYETLQDAVTAAGTWVREYEVTVINIETVVLPGRAAYVELFQFVRVWYHAND